MNNLVSSGQNRFFSPAFLAEKIRGHEGYFLFGLALLTRLIALPFSQAIESDATSRMFLADHALHQGGELASLQWPSFHIYLLSLSQFIFRDRLWGPVFISLLMGAFSVVPFYRFTKNVYNAKGAFYAALIFTFSPLIFRLSFVPLSEIYHVCFSAIALWCLSEGIVKQEKKVKWALWGGLAATMAAGGRFEAWVLIGLLGIILIVLREWKMMFVFGIAASVFPVYWMIYCYRLSGNPLISLQMVEWQNFVVGKVNDNLDAYERFKRIIFFPFSWMIAITPVVGLMSLWFFVKKIIKRKITLVQLAFGGLFFFFLPFFIYESRTGSLADQHRYTVTLVLFSTPFFALWFEDERRMGFKKTFSLLMALLIIPWSYAWQRLPWHKVFAGSEVKEEAVAELVSSTSWQATAIPNFYNPLIGEVSKTINQSLKPTDGLLIDFVGWCETYYFAQQSPLDISAMHLVPPVTPHYGDQGRVQSLFENYPQGIILLGDFSSMSPEEKLTGPILELDSVKGGILLTPVFNKKHLRLFRYFYLPPEKLEQEKQKYANAAPLFVPEKDLDYYMTTIPGDARWYAGIWKQSLSDWTSVEKQLKANAEYMVFADQQKKQEEEKTKSDSIKK